MATGDGGGADVSDRFRRYLDRRAVPRRLEGKPEALADELAALSAAVARLAPPEALDDWWPLFEAALAERGSGTVWPSERDVREAAREATARWRRAGSGRAPAVGAGELDPYEICGRRLAAGESVGEDWLYGRNAVELIARGLVNEETMRRYRAGAFEARRREWGEAAAVRWRAEAERRHDEARAIWRERRASERRRAEDRP